MLSSRLLWLLVVAAVPCAALHAEEEAIPEAAQPFMGCWKCDKQPEVLLYFQPQRLVVSNRGRVTVLPVRYEPGKMILGQGAQAELTEVAFKDGKLTLKAEEGELVEYRSVTPVPEEVLLKPMEFGKTTPSAEKIKEIRSELAMRIVEDQAVRTDASRRKDMGKVDADNTAYLTKLVKEYGWIDATRFTERAADNAFLIVQHSGNIPLMQAALPAIEKDLKSGAMKDPQDYALLYDRLCLTLGGKQRYGTQILEDEKGLCVLPLEEPSKVEQRRKEIGLYPLSQYLKMFERSGQKVRMPAE